MTRPNAPNQTAVPVPDWPEDIATWLQGRVDDWSEQIPTNEANLRQKLATDLRLKPVANTLRKLVGQSRSSGKRRFRSEARLTQVAQRLERVSSYMFDPTDSPDWPGSRAIMFLDRAIALATAYQNLREMLEAAKAIDRVTGEFASLLAKHRAGITAALLQSSLEGERSTKEPAKRYVRLLVDVNDIRQSALTNAAFLRSSELPLPRKLHSVDAREWFFARGLTFYAKFLFNRPLDREVGLLATVCLDLARTLTAERVKELRRARSGG